MSDRGRTFQGDSHQQAVNKRLDDHERRIKTLTDDLRPLLEEISYQRRRRADYMHRLAVSGRIVVVLAALIAALEAGVKIWGLQ